jgi:flagellar protein FliL
MAKDEREAQENQNNQPAPKKGLPIKWILIAVVAVLVIGGGGLGGYYFFAHSGGAKKAEKKSDVVTIWPMEPFIVNIADVGGERYLKIVVQLEVSSPEAVSELEQIKPRIRDSILDLLTPKTLPELMDLAGKQRLRDDIAGRINNSITQGKVNRVYFTEFVVQ